MMTRKPTKEDISVANSSKATAQPAEPSRYATTSTTASSGTKTNPIATATQVNTKKGGKTRITIKFDVGFNNTLYIRGNGANLSWNKGTSLKNVKNDEWVWETDTAFTTIEFKVLINDNRYEDGYNHQIQCGASIQYSPSFSG